MLAIGEIIYENPPKKGGSKKEMVHSKLNNYLHAETPTEKWIIIPEKNSTVLL